MAQLKHILKHMLGKICCCRSFSSLGCTRNKSMWNHNVANAWQMLNVLWLGLPQAQSAQLRVKDLLLYHRWTLETH